MNPNIPAQLVLSRVQPLGSDCALAHPAAVAPLILPVVPRVSLSFCLASHLAAVQGDSSSLLLPGVAS